MPNNTQVFLIKTETALVRFTINTGAEASMVMQGTVNPPPLARLVRSQDAPPKNLVNSIH